MTTRGVSFEDMGNERPLRTSDAMTAPIRLLPLYPGISANCIGFSVLVAGVLVNFLPSTQLSDPELELELELSEMSEDVQMTNCAFGDERVRDAFRFSSWISCSASLSVKTDCVWASATSAAARGQYDAAATWMYLLPRLMSSSLMKNVPTARMRVRSSGMVMRVAGSELKIW